MKIARNIILLFLGISLSQCKSFVDGVNVNPNQFTDAPPELIIGQVEIAVVMLNESQPARFAGIFTDQFTGFDRQFLAYDSYNVISGDFDDTWTNIYSSGIAQARIVQEKADKNLVLKGRAQIMEAILAGEATALYGDVPYVQSCKPLEFPNPKYDAQKDVLAAVQTLLDQAIQNVGTTTASGALFTASNATWAEIAHTLKARYYLIAKDYANARTQALIGISKVNGGLHSLHTDVTGQKNLFYQFGIEQRGGYMTVTRSHLRKLITGERARLLATPGDANRGEVYFDREELNYFDNGYFAVNAPFPIVNWYENQLILAEAQARTGNTAAAVTAFNNVRDRLAVVYGGSFPRTTATGDLLIRHILEEKYVTMIGSLQVYHDIRRTANAIGIPVKLSTSKLIPQRFIYPQVEKNANTSFPGFVDIFVQTPVNK